MATDPLTAYLATLNKTIASLSSTMPTNTAVTRVGEHGGTAPVTNWASPALPRTTNPLGGSYDTSNNASTPTGSILGGASEVMFTVGNADNGNGSGGSGNGSGGSGSNPVVPPADTVLGGTGLTATTSTELVKSILRGRGFPESMISSATDFLNTLLKENLAPGDAVDIYLNSPTYTTKDGKVLKSSFYETYGKYNDALKVKLSASDLFNTIEGYKSTADKYNLNPKFTSPDSIQQLLKNNVSVATWDERANAARLKAVTNDPFYTQSLKDLGYISGAQDLTDFYLDPTIGTEALTQKRNTVAFTTEALRQAQGTGIQIKNDYMTQTAAELSNLGYSEAQIADISRKGYQNIAEQLQPETKLSGIYEGKTAATSGQIQSELQAQEFQGLASQRRKKLAEQEAAAFQGSAGLSGTSAYLRKTSLTQGNIGAL